VSQIRRIESGRALVAVILASVLALTALPGATLCVASDGHVAIEAVGSDCSPEAAGTWLPGDALVPPTASLHSCTDTLLGTPSLTQREGDANQIVIASLSKTPAPVTPLALFSRRPAPAGSPPAAPARSRSTVRLL
jgi:hypothetical protein